jgi:hypothetical protein
VNKFERNRVSNCLRCQAAQQRDDIYLSHNALSPEKHVGQVDGLKDYPRVNLIEWRYRSEHYPASFRLFPLLAFGGWLGTLVILLVTNRSPTRQLVKN